MQDEFELIKRLKQGDARAVRQWYEQYAARLRAFFASKVRQEFDADELVHDTFLSCLASLPLYRGQAGLYTWMLSVARHELADYYRKLYAKKLIAVLPLGERLLEVAAQEPTQLGEEALTCLKHLPGELSELLALKYVDNLSVAAIAREFGTSVLAIQSRLYRARNLLRKIYEKI